MLRIREMNKVVSRHDLNSECTNFGMSARAVIHIDGACIGQTPLRPRRWAAVILLDAVERVIIGAHPATTITAWELTAGVHALRSNPPASTVEIFIGIAALVGGITERLPQWRSRWWPHRICAPASRPHWGTASRGSRQAKARLLWPFCILANCHCACAGALGVFVDDIKVLRQRLGLTALALAAGYHLAHWFTKGSKMPSSAPTLCNVQVLCPHL